MAKNSRRWPVRVVVLALVAAGVAAAVMWNRAPAAVEATRPRRAAIESSFREPARTRLAQTYVVSMPVAGRVGRIRLEPGDPVKAGDDLVAYDRVPFETAVTEAAAAVRELEASIAVKSDNRIEQTAMEQTKSAVSAAAEAVKAAQAQVEAERARSERATKELARMEALAAGRAIPQTVLDDARLAAETALIALREKEFNHASTNAMFIVVDLMPRLIDQYLGRKDLERKVLDHQLAQARARLASAEHERDLARIVSPVDGVVLERYEQGEQTLPAGTRLLMVGNLDQLEVIADVLTEDALKLHEDSVVRLEAGPGLDALPGKVKRIEPAGFTKLSSLGVEQQRVNVIVAFDARPANLGVGYRLQARFVTGARAGVLTLPRYAVMQAPEEYFYVFKVSDGRLVRQRVTVGLASDREMEITSGLTEADDVAVRPDATLSEGIRVRVENAGR